MKLKFKTANRQSTNRVRTAHTLLVDFEVRVIHRLGVWRSHARGGLDMQATAC